MAYNGPFPVNFTSATSEILVSGTSFSGGVTNAGTVGSGGIVVISSTIPSGAIANTGLISGAVTGIHVAASTIQGAIVDSGIILAASAGILVNSGAIVAGGIKVGSHGAIVASGTDGNAIEVENTPTFGGGISNAGTIGANNDGVLVSAVAAFAGGVSNSGTIIGAAYGIVVSEVSAFTGGVTNSGKISAGGESGAIFVNNVSSFSGGIVNAANGLISALTSGIGVANVSTFTGGIINKGTISGGEERHLCRWRCHFPGRHQQQWQDHCGLSSGDGILVSQINVFGNSSAGGGITNTGVISAHGTGVFIGGQAGSGGSVTLEMFSGGIRNNGTISAGVGRGIFVGGIATGTGTSVTLATVAGGITNSGRIIAGSSAPAVLVGGFASGGLLSEASVTVETFSGGVRNTGTILAAGNAILVGGEAPSGGTVTISSFSGGITNAGLISAGHHAIVVGADSATHRSRYRRSPAASSIPAPSPPRAEGIVVGRSAAASVVISTFSGGISNGGTISAKFTGIFVGPVVSFGNGIKNTGKIVTTRVRVRHCRRREPRPSSAPSATRARSRRATSVLASPTS